MKVLSVNCYQNIRSNNSNKQNNPNIAFGLNKEITKLPLRDRFANWTNRIILRLINANTFDPNSMSLRDVPSLPYGRKEPQLNIKALRDKFPLNSD